MNQHNNTAAGAPMAAGRRPTGGRALEAAVGLAVAAAEPFRRSSAAARSRLLQLIAAELDAVRDSVAIWAAAELGMPAAEAEQEHQAALQQLRACCAALQRRHWHGVAIEAGTPEQRMQQIAIGPVAILGAESQATAYAAAAADAIAALAAGCPVLVRGPAPLPRCSELLGQAIARAVATAQLPAGVYAVIDGAEHSADALLNHPGIKAATFSGSRAAGAGLMRRSLERSELIPLLLDMPSSNPVFVLPQALNARAEHLGQQLVRQFGPGQPRSACRPGLVVAIDGDGYIDLREAIIDAVSALPAMAVASRAVQYSHAGSVDRLLGDSHVDLLAEGADAAGQRAARAMFAEVDAAALLAAPALAEQRPGPAGLLVRCRDAAELLAVAARLGPQLAAGLHLADGDEALATRLLPLLEGLARHVSVNSFAAVPRYTGASAACAMARFLRPVFYLDVPPSLLPAALQEGQPLQLWRPADGEMRH